MHATIAPSAGVTGEAMRCTSPYRSSAGCVLNLIGRPPRAAGANVPVAGWTTVGASRTPHTCRTARRLIAVAHYVRAYERQVAHGCLAAKRTGCTVRRRRGNAVTDERSVGVHCQRCGRNHTTTTPKRGDRGKGEKEEGSVATAPSNSVRNRKFDGTLHTPGGANGTPPRVGPDTEADVLALTALPHKHMASSARRRR